MHPVETRTDIVDMFSSCMKRTIFSAFFMASSYLTMNIEGNNESTHLETLQQEQATRVR